MPIRRFLVLVFAATWTAAGLSLEPPVGEHAGDGEVAGPAQRSNIVMVLLDDMSSNLLQYMNVTTSLIESSVVFDSSVVATPLCCPSRATLLTGKYAHNTRVLTNNWPVGGFGRFYLHDLGTSLGPYLQAAGYRTGLAGKFLNGYSARGNHDGHGAPDYPRAYVPPGWRDWFVIGNGYQGHEYNAVVGRDGKSEIISYDGDDEDHYLTDVLASEAEDFIDRASTGQQPFFLLVAPFAVHSNVADRDPYGPDHYRFPAAPRDRADSLHRPPEWDEPEFPLGDCGDPIDGGCADVVFPDPMNEGNFNIIPQNPPAWAPSKPLTQKRIAELRELYIERIQMVQSVDDLVGRVLDQLALKEVTESTYVILTSDNGFHIGEHAMTLGKSAAYDHDVVVPLVIHSPGAGRSAVISELVQNTDLLPTFLEIAGHPVPDDVDGVSLLDLVGGLETDRWRQGALIEFDDREPTVGRIGPDRETGASATSYTALRTHDYLYVDYSKLDEVPPHAEAELYDLRSDPDMIVNVWGNQSAEIRAQLNAELLGLRRCDGRECWRRELEVPSLN